MVARKPRSMTIGVVLDQLQQEFPDVTVSKIRFWEAEGLICPQRTASGYRRFTEDDVARLRYILVTQRDSYLPLKVIREQLAAMDSGQVSVIGVSATPLISPETFGAPKVTRLRDFDVARDASVSVKDVQELANAGIIRADEAGFFTNDDVQTVQTAQALKEFGFDVRHLKSIKNGAARQASLIGQIAGPIARQNKDSARQQAEEISRQMTALAVSLHASLVKSSLRDDIGL